MKSNMHSTIDFCPRPDQPGRNNVPVHKKSYELTVLIYILCIMRMTKWLGLKMPLSHGSISSSSIFLSVAAKILGIECIFNSSADYLHFQQPKNVSAWHNIFILRNKDPSFWKNQSSFKSYSIICLGWDLSGVSA